MSISMVKTIPSLDVNFGFGFVDLGLSEEENRAISSFSIKGDDTYEYCPHLEASREPLCKFLDHIGSGQVRSVAETIHRIAYSVIHASGKETALISVRVSTPHDEFDKPRWHIDGFYYEGSSLKFAAALIGNPTLFYPLPVTMRPLFNENLRNREALTQLLTHKPVTASRGEGSFFTIGNNDTGAVHSEPKIDSPRLFFSVLPGNKNEIDAHLAFQKAFEALSEEELKAYP